MLWKTQRDPNGNLRYPLEHTPEDQTQKFSLNPKSQQFADTTPTLGVNSRGFHFTGRTTESDGYNAGIHSERSLLYDVRQNNESFIESRVGATTNPSFKTPVGGPSTTGPVPAGVEFVPSQAEPSAQGQGGKGPTWWDRITSNIRAGTNTQSTNLGVKPAEKFQIGLRSSEQKPIKVDQVKPTKETGLMTNTGSAGSPPRMWTV